jgi:hypothetical protein
MAKKPVQDYSWRISRLRGTPAAEVGPAWGPPWLGVGPFTQTFYYRQDLVCSAVMNKVNGALAIQEPVLGVEPESRFVRRIELCESIHHITKIGDKKLSLWVRECRSGSPTRNGGRRDGRDVGNIRSFQAAPLSKIINHF